MDLFGIVGARWRRKAENLSYALGFLGRVLRESLLFFRHRQVGFRVLVLQILFTGVEALPVTAVTALSVGVAINFIGAAVLSSFGQGKLAYTLLIIIVTKELGPLLTAFIVIARSGTAIATELGGMMVDHEVEAYVAVGIDPITYLAVPRFLGVVVSLVTLGVYFNLFGLLGSFGVMQVIHPLGLDDYVRNLFSVLTVPDLLAGLFKCLVFGIIISVVSLHRGFAVEGSSTEVPVAGIKAVSSSFVLCIVTDAVITAVQYLA